MGWRTLRRYWAGQSGKQRMRVTDGVGRGTHACREWDSSVSEIGSRLEPTFTLRARDTICGFSASRILIGRTRGLCAFHKAPGAHVSPYLVDVRQTVRPTALLAAD